MLDSVAALAIIYLCEKKDMGNFSIHGLNVKPFNYSPYLFFSPQLLCSGEVLRYQFKPYPKPDRSNRPSAKLVTSLEPLGKERGPEYTKPTGGKGGRYDWRKPNARNCRE